MAELQTKETTEPPKKRVIILEIVPTELFDLLKKNPALIPELGNRLVGAAMAETSLQEDLGLALYGIRVLDDKARPYLEKLMRTIEAIPFRDGTQLKLGQGIMAYDEAKAYLDGTAD